MHQISSSAPCPAGRLPPGEFQVLLDDEKTEDLKRMYDLMRKIASGLAPLRELLEKHVSTQGLEAIAKVEDAISDSKAYVLCLLQVPLAWATSLSFCFSFFWGVVPCFRRLHMLRGRS